MHSGKNYPRAKSTPIPGKVEVFMTNNTTNQTWQSGSHSLGIIESLCLQPSCNMLSHDVDSLFSNVPLDDILSFLSQKATEGLLHFPFQTDIFLELLRLCWLVTSLSDYFQRKIVSQTFGVYVWVPLSAILANYYMEYFETLFLPATDTRLSIFECMMPFLLYGLMTSLFLSLLS